MENINLDEKWTFRRGLLDSLGIIDSYAGETVNLPHDGMISLSVTKDAPAVTDSGYFPGDICKLPAECLLKAHTEVLFLAVIKHIFILLILNILEKIEMMTMWGFPDVTKNWNFSAYENKDVELIVYTKADEVELYVNGKLIERKAAKMNVEVEKAQLKADGHDVSYVNIQILDENNNPVTDAAINLVAELESDNDAAVLAAFGTGNPITEEKYPDNKTQTFRGQATAIIRSGYKEGNACLKIKSLSEALAEVEVKISVK